MNCANWKDNMHTFQTTRFCLKLSLSGWFPVQCRSFVPVLEKRRRKYKECCVTVANVTRNVIWHALATSFHRERVDVLFRLGHESLFLYRWRFWASFTASRNEVRCCEWLGQKNGWSYHGSVFARFSVFAKNRQFKIACGWYSTIFMALKITRGQLNNDAKRWCCRKLSRMLKFSWCTDHTF